MSSLPPTSDLESRERDGSGSERHVPDRRGVLRRVPGEVYVLAAIAAVSRFAFLGSPKAIVFDEVYFREYALRYQEGTYYFDLHPPLGKLLLGAWAWISGTDVSATGTDPAVALRLIPALAGTALIIAFYFLLRRLSGSRRIATLGAGLLLLDNALLVESRLTTLDSMLLLFGIGGVTLALRAREHQSKTSRGYWLLLLAAVALGGAAASTKLTGLGALGLVGVIWLLDLLRRRQDLRRRWKSVVGQGLMLIVVPITIYTASFAVHFSLLPESGQGDAFMSQEFQATLEGNPSYSPGTGLSFAGKFTDLNRAIHQYELSLNDVTHPYQSSWTSWPVNKRGVFVYLAAADNEKSSYIYVLGNPVVWWGVVLGAAVVIGGWALRRERFRPYRWPLGFLAFAWAVNYFPFALIERPMFIYHYFFALMFSLAFVVIGLGVLTGWIEDRPRPFSFGSRLSAVGFWSILGVAGLVFLYFGPITYGIPLTPEELDSRMWLSSWR
ncbi:MAG: phospholipid carrier-dependent glycosyltransferase [Nocardioides sp.]